MPDPHRKQKMISLRLSEVEYEVLKAHHGDYGAHNVSELARLALQRMVTAPAAPQDAFAAKLLELDNRMRDLESKLRAIRVLFEPSPSKVKSEPL